MAVFLKQSAERKSAERCLVYSLKIRQSFSWCKFVCTHIKEENPTYEELKSWYTRSGLPLKKFFNTSGMLYKEMQLKDKLPDMGEEEQLKLLATNGMLVKRPLIVGDDVILTGFKEKEWAEKLKD